MIRGVIFDLGGTLMHFEGNWEEVDASSILRLVEYLRKRGIAVGDDFPPRFRAARERGWKIAEEQGIEARIDDALAEALEELGIIFSRNGLLPDALRVYYEEGEQRWNAYPDAMETLRELQKRNLRIGLISNADSEHIVYGLVQQLGFALYLDPVISSASVPRWRKPDPRIFHLISDAWKVEPNEIAMVGDTVRYDILGAHRAGMRGILIDRGDNAPWQRIPNELLNDPLIKPDLTIHTLAEIPLAIQLL
jgi:putative hydrolase of the HAD superfamily